MPPRPPSLPSPSRRSLRIAVAIVVVLTVVSLTHSFLTYSAAGSTGIDGADRTLVATVDGTGPGQVAAYGSDGSRTYRNRSLWLYHDVDPAGPRTVEYVGSEVVDGSHPSCDAGRCMRNVVERANLTSGAVTERWVSSEPIGGSTQIHDVDRVNESVLLVADISHPDRVFMVNTTTGEVVWEWRVAEAFANDTGGSYPGDWTHVNDVEYLPDGRVMINLRNQDQVVFIEPGEGLQRDWTLGSDDDHDTLYEQHNPDYIPESRGGPAVLVADSENNRIVEYRRVGGEWTRSWVWADRQLQWPRDADRLPNGNTLVVDSHGARLLSIAPDGSVAWSTPFSDGGYDVEMLGTGDESAGPSAARADLASRSPSEGRPSLTYLTVSLVPPLVLHGILYALPIWVGPSDAVLLLVVVPAVVGWLVVEAGLRARRRG